jgi:hypothetical protein
MLLLLLGANLGAFLWLSGKITSAGQPPAGANPSADASQSKRDSHPSEDSREQFARSLHALLRKQGGNPDWSQAQLLAQYEQLASHDPGLRLKEDNREGRLAVGMVGLLSQRSAEQVRDTVKKALANKGYSPNLVEAACKDVYQQLLSDARKGQ